MDSHYPTVDAPNALTPAACAAPPTTLAGAGDWPVYHRTPERRGVDTVSPRLSTLKGAWADQLDGPLLASPVVAGEMVVAATENDTVYGLAADSGCVAWSRHLGDPVDATKQQCRPFPTIGITATPAIDVPNGLVYVLAYLQPSHHRVFALDLATGTIRFQREIDPAGSDPSVQLARGALALANGRLYAALGGRAGDCGGYHGYVIGVALDLSGEPDLYTVPSARAGGIWSPAGVSLLRGGDLLVATGNGDSTTTYDGGNSVVRLSPALKPIDVFSPPNWSNLTRKDLDLGSVGPTLVDGGQVFQVGKEGVGYLLDGKHLGGVGGQLLATSLHGCYAIGATAYWAPYVYVPCDHGLKAVNVKGGTIHVDWTGPDFRSGSPILAGGVVWSLDFEGGYLWAFNPRYGNVIVRSRVGAGEHFVSPSTANGRLFAPVGRYLYAYSGI
jgi:outer membrane protein assembly factor BamB